MFDFLRSKTRKVKCPDGTTRFVYEDLDDACPLYIPSYKADVASDLKATSEINGNVSVKYAREIDNVLYGLNEQNQSLMMSFRTVYLTYKSNPCGNDEFFHRGIEGLLDDQKKISLLKVKVNALITLARAPNTDEVRLNMIFAEIASLLGGSSVASTATVAINEARDIALTLLNEGAK